MYQQCNQIIRPCLAVLILGMIVPCSAVAAKVNFEIFCPELAGNWAGSAAKWGEAPKAVTVTGVCSGDRRQLILSVSVGTHAPFSETWWFRAQGERVLLTYFDGVSADKQQLFSLYRQQGNYSLLGEGEINARPALIQLLFEVKASAGQGQAWQWTQNMQYLDTDIDRYQLFRGIELNPVPPVLSR